MVAEVHPFFPMPQDTSVRLWRYMNLPKFVWMLQKRALYFARADRLGDPYEGHYTRINALGEDRYVESCRENFKSANQPFDEAEYRRSFKILLQSALTCRRCLFVNSWHLNERESSAMWRLYSSLDEGICITTTFDRLCTSLPSHTFCGMVRYLDYETEWIDMLNVFSYIMCKRLSYSHEREVRAVRWLNEPEQIAGQTTHGNGVAINIEMEALVTAVYLSPSTSPLMREVVQGLLQSCGLTVPVLQSEVNAPPPF